MTFVCFRHELHSYPHDSRSHDVSFVVRLSREISEGFFQPSLVSHRPPQSVRVFFRYAAAQVIKRVSRWLRLNGQLMSQPSYIVLQTPLCCTALARTQLLLVLLFKVAGPHVASLLPRGGVSFLPRFVQAKLHQSLLVQQVESVV